MDLRTAHSEMSPATLRHLRIWSTVALIVTFGLSVLLLSMSINKRSATNTTHYTPTQVNLAGEQSKVYFGLYTLAVHDINFGEQSFQYDGYVWVRFTGDSLKGMIELMNTKTATMTLVDQRDSGNNHYAAYRIKGSVAANYSLQHFPFDAQSLTIEFESPRFEKRDLVFVPDSMSFAGYDSGYVGMERGMRIADYDIVNSQIYVTDHAYPTDFGLPETGIGLSLFTRAVLEIHIQRQFAPYLTKFLFPIFLMLFVTYFVFFVPVYKLEISVVICATSLFTAIAIGLLQLEMTMHVGYLMTTDRFYVLSYIMILLAFMEIIVGSNAADKNMAWADALDIWSRWLFFPLCGLGMLIIAMWEFFTP